MWVKILTLLSIIFSMYNCEVAVLILARGGSKGVRLKNLQKVGVKSLLGQAIFTARAAGFNDITVSTDHPLIALEAIKDNATIINRSPVTATDSAPSIWGAAEFLALRPDVTILLLIQVTSPFIRPSHLRTAVEQINFPVPYDCIFAVTRSYKHRWSFMKGKFCPANFQVGSRVRRQDQEGEFFETGAFYITRRLLIEEGTFQNNNCTVFEVGFLESLEVDTELDLKLANTVLSANLV